MRPSRSAANRAMSGSAGSGSGVRSSRWNVPPDAAARSATIGRHDAAGRAGDDEDGVVGEPRRPSRPTVVGSSCRPIAQRCPVAWPISTAPGSAASRRGARRRSQAALVVGGRRRPPSPRRRPARRAYAFAKPVTAPPSGASAPAVVVAVKPAESGRGDDERRVVVDAGNGAWSRRTTSPGRRRASRQAREVHRRGSRFPVERGSQ